MKLREILQWLTKLLPQQKVKGDGNFQAGRVEGNLSNTQTTTHQTIYNNTIYVMATDQPAANESQPAPLMAAPPSAADKKPATAEQLEVLRIMRMSTAARDYAEAFMRRHFNTTRVKSLDDLQCKRTRCWVDACLERDAQACSKMQRVG